MGRSRFTLGGGMALIAAIAVCLAALVNPTRTMASASLSLALAFHFAAIVAAIARPGRSRAACSSFAVCGLGYFGTVAFNLWLQDIYHILITDNLIGWLSERIRNSTDSLETFLICHSIASLIAGFGGALLARFLWLPHSDLPRPTLSTSSQS